MFYYYSLLLAALSSSDSRIPFLLAPCFPLTLDRPSPWRSPMMSHTILSSNSLRSLLALLFLLEYLVSIKWKWQRIVLVTIFLLLNEQWQCLTVLTILSLSLFFCQFSMCYPPVLMFGWVAIQVKSQSTLHISSPTHLLFFSPVVAGKSFPLFDAGELSVSKMMASSSHSLFVLTCVFCHQLVTLRPRRCWHVVLFPCRAFVVSPTGCVRSLFFCLAPKFCSVGSHVPIGQKSITRQFF